MMNDTWFEYKSKSGRTLFIYNKQTGEHKWVSEHLNGSLQEDIVQGKLMNNKQFCSTASQTDDYNCDNGCLSMFVVLDSDNISNASPQLEPGFEDNDNYNCLGNISETPSEPPISIVHTSQVSEDGLEKEYTEDLSFQPQASALDNDKHVLCSECNNDIASESSGSQEGDTRHNLSGNQVRIIKLQNVEHYQLDDDEVPSMLKVFEFSSANCLPRKSCESKDNSIDTCVENCTQKDISEFEGCNSEQILDSLTCPYCLKTMESKSEVICHLRSHTAVEAPFECSVCNKKFKKKTSLVYHFRQHTGEWPFECSYCDKKFAQKCSLSYHLGTHVEEKPYECRHCEKKFVRRCDLNLHEKIHTSKRPFGCDLCDKRFLRKDHLKGHMRTHGGAKPFQCPHCDKKFAQRGTLTYHIKTHTGEKSFHCSICNRDFIHRGHLNQHLRSYHSGERPFKCPYCDVKFSKKRSLNYHIKTHLEEKPHQCHLCESKFSKKEDLDSHLKTRHVPGGSYQCPYCLVKFLQKGYLDIHMKDHFINT